jgi:RHS repeat-associated protein
MSKGVNTFNTINSTTYNNYGLTTRIRSLNSSGIAINRFNYSFTYNTSTGNMLSRRDHVANQQEHFQYDALQRLTQFQVGTQPVRTSTYAADGNILSKFDAGTYAYAGPFKNAVSSIAMENSSSTNPAPSAIPVHTQNIQYTAFDQPAVITENNRSLLFGYGADDMRNYSVMQTNGAQNYIRYHLGSMDREISGNTVRDVHHIDGPAGTIAIIVKENDNWNYYYTFTDPLGSILYVYNENGTINTRQSFDAWGRYRSATNWNTYDVSDYPRPWLYRGYTGHEMLPAFNLVNMNGRLYDPLSARMLSADPIINSIYSTQAYNRFSYVWNNPLKFVDPNGYDGKFAQWIKKPFQITSDRLLSSFNFGGSYFSSESYDPLDHALAQGPPGGMLRTAADLTPFVGSSLMMYDGYNEGSWLTFGIGAAFLTWDIFTFGSGSLIRGGARLGVRTFAVKTSTKLLPQFANSTIEDAVGLIMKDPNKLAHLFAPKHNLDILVSKLGGKENTVRAVLNAANGMLPSSGVFNNIIVNVGGQNIIIRGSVIDGIPRLGTMFIP